MKSFVARHNIERYERLLEAAADEASRRVLLDLLAEEKAKLAELASEGLPPQDTGHAACEGTPRKQ
jgi:hypothetical protein